jgi:hypothetical protein
MNQEDLEWKVFETFSKVTRFVRNQLEGKFAPSPSRIDDTEWDLMKDEYIKRWSQTVFQDTDDFLYEQQQKDRITKGGVYLLMDEDLVREMETQLGNFELVQVSWFSQLLN